MGTVNLIKDTVYRGRVIIFYPSLVVTESKVKEELEKVGFTNVRVWLDSDDIPSDWPSSARSDVSSTMSTQAWLEAGWGKPTGDYPSSGSKWQLNDYWVQKAAPVAYQPPVQTKEPEENGPPLLTCVTEGMSCDQTPCCDGTTCRQDSDGYWGGGLRCMTGNTGLETTGGEDGQTPTQVNEPPKASSKLWWVLGAFGVAGAIGVVALIKSRQEVMQNPSGGQLTLPGSETEQDTELVRKHADSMPAPGPWRVERPLVPVLVLARYGDVFVHRFPEFYESGHLDTMWVLSTNRPGEGYKEILICFTEKAAFSTAKYIGQGAGKKLLEAVYADLELGHRSIHDSEAIRAFDEKIRAYAWKHR